MAITVTEKWDSRSQTAGPSASAELNYVVRGTTDELAAHVAMVDASPLEYAGLIRQSSTLEPLADGVWEGSVRYGAAQPREPGLSTFSFDTGGGQQQVTQSLATVQAKAPAGKTPPNFRGAISVTKDSVDGVSITVPIFNFSETHILANLMVTPALRANLFAMTGRVNNAPFRGFAAGEVLFLGASGSSRDKDTWEISYKFAASPNATDLSVGNISGLTKRGWDYLWVRYADVEDEESSTLVKQPVAVYVEQVYPFGNFAALGIGV